jgi:hypothetical protein
VDGRKLALLMAAAALSMATFAVGRHEAVHANGDCNTAAYGTGCVAPANVTNTVSGQNVQLNWQMPQTAALPYAQTVERGSSPFQVSVIQTFTSGKVQTSYTDQNVPPGTYFYAVCNVYPNLVDQSEDDECSFAMPEGVQVKAPSAPGNSGPGPGSGSGSGGQPQQPPAAGHSSAAAPNPQCNPPTQLPDANHVILYVNAGFAGDAPCVNVGIGSYPSTASCCIPDDSLSSFRVGSNVQLVICEDANYRGACSTFTNDVASMTSNGDLDANLRRVVPTNGPGMDNDHMSSLCVQRRGTPPSTPCGSALIAPGDPTVSDRSQTSITLQFSAGSGGDYVQLACKGDAVDPRCAVGGNGLPSHLLSFDAAGDAFQNLQPDRNYSFQACEWLSSGPPSACSDWTSFHTLPPAPTDLQGQNPTPTSIVITWTTNITDGASPVIYTVSRNDAVVSPAGGIRPLNLSAIVETEGGQPSGGGTYPKSGTFTDSFTVDTSQDYVYKVCATDLQAADGPVSACASYTVPLINVNFTPADSNPIAPYNPTSPDNPCAPFCR